ncbi:alpha/beta fold hydrolase [Saccharothrix coeruleofusca]|uniref:3-oxoadipate enol-lactone hydrolase n=1 Tax=Saccharothrix coeruleofusca TaxID=33919 RepID=A0A918AJM8_9PSEU|nr:alpha/beta hydrolase [Saccharothrix coeruleofusca]MBP2340445.1 pimeloyl-ACP methyl ester carboxylesterase [Saccharothrix coeruleofusca]GGP35292.1 3-oxoadipate enol-lactone hydrolase [Saccharothrix coeruleofusca]
MTTGTKLPLGRVVRGSGPGLLLAHGAGGGVDANFGPILDGLAERRTVVGPDYPGTGRTPRAAGPLSLDGLADDLVAAAVEEGLETFAVAGYSLGAAVAVRAATRHPDRVTALVLTAGFARPNPRMLLAVRLWRELLEAGDRERLAAFLALMATGAPALDRLSQEALDAAVADTAASIPPGTAQHVDLAAEVDVRDDLAAIRVPTLVVCTRHDALVTPFLQRQLAEATPGAELVELEAGHLPFAERPAEWLAAIREFLDRGQENAARRTRRW